MSLRREDLLIDISQNIEIISRPLLGVKCRVSWDGFNTPPVTLRASEGGAAHLRTWLPAVRRVGEVDLRTWPSHVGPVVSSD